MTRPGGFTLIEVLGAIVIFAVGVLVAARLSVGLSAEIENAALRSAVVVEGQELLDSLSAVPYDSLAVGSTSDTLILRNREFARHVTISESGPRVRGVKVLIEPLSPPAPVFSTTTYVFERW